MITDVDQQSSPLTRGRWWLLAAGATVAVWGVVVLVLAFSIRQPTAFRPLGPRVFPVAIATALFFLGVSLVVQTIRGSDAAVVRHVDESIAETSFLQAGGMIALLVAYATAFEPLGYVVATALFFPVAARLLGSRHSLRDVVVGVIVTGVTAAVFDRLLGVGLPAGLLEEVV